MSTETLNEVLQDERIAEKAQVEARQLSAEARAESAGAIRSLNESVQKEVGMSRNGDRAFAHARA